jgi:hypothetical protein
MVVRIRRQCIMFKATPASRRVCMQIPSLCEFRSGAVLPAISQRSLYRDLKRQNQENFSASVTKCPTPFIPNRRGPYFYPGPTMSDPWSLFAVVPVRQRAKVWIWARYNDLLGHVPKWLAYCDLRSLKSGIC